jgi:hypothetical protein
LEDCEWDWAKIVFSGASTVGASGLARAVSGPRREGTLCRHRQELLHLDVLDKLPQWLYAGVRKAVHAMYEAPRSQACAGQRVTYCAQARAGARPTPPSTWNGTGTTSPPSMTSPRSTGSTCAPATPSSRPLPGYRSEPTLSSACRFASASPTWCSSWRFGSAPFGAGAAPVTS